MGLRQNILHDKVSQLELRQVITVGRDVTVSQSVQLMRDRRLGCVVVVDEDDRPLGKFTERLLNGLLLRHPRAMDEPVKDHMASAWAKVNLSDPIATVIELMEAMKLRFVVVVDEQGHPVGLTGQKGVMQYIADHFPRQVRVQPTGAKLYMDQREGA